MITGEAGPEEEIPLNLPPNQCGRRAGNGRGGRGPSQLLVVPPDVAEDVEGEKRGIRRLRGSESDNEEPVLRSRRH